MGKAVYPFILVIILFAACNPKSNAPSIPDLRNEFNRLLLEKDSTIVLDSFRLVGVDTMTAKSAIYRQRFRYFKTMKEVEHRRDSIVSRIRNLYPGVTREDAAFLSKCDDEQKVVRHEVDSLNKALTAADSVSPIGYRAIYRVTLHKAGRFNITDSIAYSISMEMKVQDWDRNVDKAADSLAIGRHPVGIEYRQK